MHPMCTRCIKNVLKIRSNTYALYYSFVLFLLAIVLSVLLRYTESDCPFGIFKIFFQINFSRFSINGGYWKNKMRSRKILHRCNDSMRGLSPHFYMNISKDMRCHISIHQFKIQNSATIAVFYWHTMYLQTQPDCSPICISTDFILISPRFTHVGQLLHYTLTHVLNTEFSITSF